MKGGFGRLYRSQPRIRAKLGCPLQAEQGGAAAEQVFEGGTMYWWGASRRIYVLFGKNGGNFGVYADTYTDADNLSDLSPPPGYFEPGRGFGKVWRNYAAVGDSLGWGVGPEAEMAGAYQRFAQGTMLFAPAANGHGPLIYVLYADGTFAVYPDTQ